MASRQRVVAQVEGVHEAAEDLAESRPVGWAARLGLTARGVIYLLMGVLGVLVALGHPGKRADQQGVVAEVVSHPYGTGLAILLVAGFAGYSLWRLSEAAFGVTGEGRRVGPRVQSLARAIAYAILTVTAFSIVRGSRPSQGAQQRDLTARTLAHPYGQWIVGAVGAAIVVVGLVLAFDGARGKFMKYFRGVPPRVHGMIRRLGQIGSVARGLVFCLVGVLVISAAWTYDPNRAKGIDGALRTLLQQPYGKPLALAAAAGLIAFGVYGLAEARYRRV